jgi:type IV secretion system protein VirB1
MSRLFERRRALLLAAGAAWAAYGVPDTAIAAPLSTAEFETLAAYCAPSVPAATLEALAKTESALDPWALHDNATNRTELPASLPAALARAQRWIGRGDSVDLGLMQIDSANLARLGLSIANAFDACRSIEAGAHILEEDYRAAARDTLSRYNTGDPVRGIVNGYVARVEASFADIAADRLPPSTEPPPSPTPARGWNIFASRNGERFVSTDSNSGGH